MNYLFVGVDVSKDTIDVAICDSESKVAKHLLTVSNDIAEIEKLIDQLQNSYQEQNLWFCFEHTGNYQLVLEHQLHEQQILYTVTPALQIKRSLGITRGKNDKIDAIRIAEYAAIHQHKLSPCCPKSDKMQNISCLLASRQLLVRNNTACKNHLKSLIKTHQCVPVQSSIDRIKAQIELMKKQILEIESEIKNIIFSSEKLKKTFDKITSIPGIGLLTASSTILYTNNFSSFTDYRKFSSYCGVAPFQNRSGTSLNGKTKTSQLRNKQMKKLLFAAALTAIRYDHQLARYYKRKIEQGKHKMSVRNAVASKLIARMFAVSQRDEAYINFSF